MFLINFFWATETNKKLRFSPLLNLKTQLKTNPFNLSMLELPMNIKLVLSKEQKTQIFSTLPDFRLWRQN